MNTTIFFSVCAIICISLLAARVSAQSCSATSDFKGDSQYLTGEKPARAPLRGNIGCVDMAALARRPKADPQNQDAINIYGPMEAGFTSSQPGTRCLGDNSVPGGVDTNTADHVIAYLCGEEISILDYCGGHARPYHYHEKMTCLYDDADPTNALGLKGHSSRIGTALDGNGIYGRFIEGGKIPTDLDACGGRTGVTPDSNGASVYYYVITDTPPFSVGCFGKKDHFTTVDECRKLYPKCSNGQTTTLTTSFGTGTYNLDCPCYDTKGSNMDGSSGVPGYLDSSLYTSDVATSSQNGGSKILMRLVLFTIGFASFRHFL